jgi:hypothetical protein
MADFVGLGRLVDLGEWRLPIDLVQCVKQGHVSTASPRMVIGAFEHVNTDDFFGLGQGFTSKG